MVQDADLETLRALAANVAAQAPQGTLAWTAAVDIAARESVGMSPLGERFIVPILGGRFWGGPGFGMLAGRVRSGGADRQLLRADGVKELRAEYEMETFDGTVLTVLNQVIVDDAVKPTRYAISTLRVAAPDGPLAWLNRRVFVGTLQSLRPAREAVLVRSWLVA